MLAGLFSLHLTYINQYNNEPEMLTSWWCQRTSQVITKGLRIHPLGTMNVCAAFPFFWDIFQTEVVN